MKNIFGFIFSFFVFNMFGQISNTIIKENNYIVEGNEELIAKTAIILKPTTWIKQGSTFTAKINSSAYTLPILDTNKNYIYTQVFQEATTDGNISLAESVIEDVSYFDGLGRKTQSKAIGQSPLGKDIVTHYEYDALGRQAKNYLPYVSSQNNGLFEVNGQTKTIAYYNTVKYQNTTNPYSEKAFDGSPFNRVLETGAPGVSWVIKANNDTDHTTKMGYAVNTATDALHKIRWYKVSLDANYTPSLSNPSPYYYPLNSLYKTIVKNENWTPTSGKVHTTEEFTNKFGQTILKRTYFRHGSTIIPNDTYYVYDLYNNLSYIIPPLTKTSDGINTSELNELCFQYKYDKYNRLIEKKIPGKGWEYIVYDLADRPILIQDALQRAKTTKEWLFTKYDALGRVVYSGVYKNNSSRAALQAAANTHSVKHEKKGKGGFYYYTNLAYPTGITSNNIYIINYYDDYGFDRNGLNVPAIVYGKATTTNLKSLATGGKERVLDADNNPTNYWVTSIIGYDEKVNPIYNASKNSFLGTTDISQIKLDFVGKVLESSNNHDSNTSVDIVDKFTYDHVGRLLTQKQQINTQPEELIVKNSYDELGVLENKKVGNTEATPLQTIDYKYNIRGWLTNINDVDNIGNDLFTFKLNYNTKDITPTNEFTNVYNGNISETIWRTKSDNKKRGYQYKYDGLSRLLGANYRENNDLASGSGKFETNYAYDKNGNLSTLNRKGSDAQFIDNLDYSNEYNKLDELVDSSGSTEGVQAAQVTYDYDVNGNLTSDTSKGITSIEYNHLNLPTKVHFGNSQRIEYIYTANGTKLQKNKIDGIPTTTKYAGSFIYVNNVLKHFSQPEGYVEKNGSSFTYVYQYTDHLGNIRLNYTNTGSRTTPNLQIREENHYYPFGMKHKGYGPSITGIQNNYKYNGKEYQDDVINGKRLDWYDYEARNYDATIGRFFNVDPLADSPMQVDKSPYAYTWNNPINLTDPDGMHPGEIKDIGGGRAGQEQIFVGDISFGFDSSGSFVSSGTTKGKTSKDPKQKLKESTKIKYGYNKLENGDKEHTLTETIQQEVWDLHGKTVTVKKLEIINTYKLTVSVTTSAYIQTVDLSESFSQKVSDITESSHLLIKRFNGIKGSYDYSLGPKYSDGHISKNGFEKVFKEHNSEMLAAYARSLKLEVFNDKNYTPYNGSAFLATSTGVAGVLVGLSNLHPAAKVGFGIAGTLANAFRNFYNHSGRSHQLEEKSRK